MCDVIFEIERKARKKHECNSCFWLFELSRFDISGLTIAQYRRYINLKKNKGMIHPGDKYIQLTMRHDGEIITVRYLPEAHELCLKLGAYPDFC